MQEAYQAGIMGNPDYLWMLSGDAVSIFTSHLALDPSSDADLVAALDGVGYFEIRIPPNQDFSAAISEIPLSPTLQKELISLHPDKYPYENFNFTGTTADDSYYQKMSYDAMMAMGLAICNAPQEYPTGPQIYQSFLNLVFSGASGDLLFEPNSGTRGFIRLHYSVVNAVKQNVLVNGSVRYTTNTTSVVDFDANPQVVYYSPFIYAQGSTKPPSPGTSPSSNLNLIPPWVRGFGFALFGIVCLASIGWAIFTYKFRKTAIVKASQPFFLFMTCAGTLTMAQAILMFGFQEPMPLQLWILPV